MDPLLNPPRDLKVRMCREYLKQMARRHVGALGEFEQRARRAANTQIAPPKVRAESCGGEPQSAVTIIQTRFLKPSDDPQPFVPAQGLMPSGIPVPVKRYVCLDRFFLVMVLVFRA